MFAPRPVAVTTLLNAVTANGAGSAVAPNSVERSFQASIAGTGALVADVDIEVSNDGVNFIVAETIALSDDDADTDGLVMDAPWKFVRGVVRNISGTGAAVTLTMGIP